MACGQTNSCRSNSWGVAPGYGENRPLAKQNRKIAQLQNSQARVCRSKAKTHLPAPRTRTSNAGLMLGPFLGITAPSTPRADQAQPLFLINTTDKPVMVPGTMTPKSVAVHPRPTTGVAVVWQSPTEGQIKISGRVSDAHVGGDGVQWVLEKVRRRGTVQLAKGTFGTGRIATDCCERSSRNTSP